MDTPKESRGHAKDGDMPRSADSISGACGAIALVGVAAIGAICLAVQFLRTDLNWITTPMSLYVKGPWGGWVQASFFAPAPGIAALGVGWYRVLRTDARSMASMALFFATAAALCLTGAFVADPTASPVTLHGEIHQWAAFGTFLFVTTGMAVQSWKLHRDPHWGRHFMGAFSIAAVTIVYFWIYALWKPIPRGVGEKIVITLVLVWVWRAGWWLVRGQPGRHPAPRKK